MRLVDQTQYVRLRATLFVEVATLQQPGLGFIPTADCAWPILRALKDLPRRRNPPDEQIFLPYVIAALFGIGYGSVVAAERVSPARRRVSSLRSSGDGVKCGRGISSASRKSGGGGSSGDDCSSSAGSDRSGARNIDQLSFADQVRARDSRDEAGAHTSADDDDDYDDDDDDNDEAVLSGGGSDNESPTVERRSERVPTVSAASSGNRQLAKERGADSSSDNGKDDRGSSGSCDGVRTNHRMSTPGACDAAEIEQPSSRPLAVGSPNTDGVDTEETDDVGISGRGSVSNNVAERNGARGVEDGVTNRDRGTSVDPSVDVGIFRQRGFSSADGDDDEEEDEDSGGWGQVIVNPVKVARWDERGKRSKTALSLNQLRTLIIERAESAPQEATYRRATKLVSANPKLSFCFVLFCSFSTLLPFFFYFVFLLFAWRACRRREKWADPPQALTSARRKQVRAGRDGTSYIQIPPPWPYGIRISDTGRFNPIKPRQTTLSRPLIHNIGTYAAVVGR